MLIGISGKMGSGKNLVCTIIQGLTAAKKHNIENPSFEWIKKYYINSIWEQKAFASKLKQTASLLTGIPVEKFEDHEFKNKELGEEWWYTYGMKISGEERHDFLVPITEMDEYFKNSSSAVIVKLTPRMLLQQIGTECIRDKVHPNAWVNALFADYKSNLCDNGIFATMKMENGSTISWIPNPILEPNSYPNWIITDMRFPNEMDAVKSRGGITIRVNRPCEECGMLEGHKMIPHKKQDSLHPSETALDNAEFDYTIENNSSIEDLIHTVSLILKREKII